MNAIDIYLGKAGWVVASLAWALFPGAAYAGIKAYDKNPKMAWNVLVSVGLSMIVLGTIIISIPANGSELILRIQEYIEFVFWPLVTVFLITGFEIVQYAKPARSKH